MAGIRWPIAGSHPITQGFGRPAAKVEPTMYLQVDAGGDRKCRPTAFAGAVEFQDVHPGVDVSCPVGTAVLAPERGRVAANVTYRVWSPIAGAYVTGRYVLFRFGQAIMLVDHLSKFSRAEGAQVERGGVIARTGNSGITYGPHAHVEVRQLVAGDTAQDSWRRFRWNVERLRVGADLAGAAFIRPA